MSVPDYDRKAEASAILASEDSRLGEIFRGDRDGLSLDEQALQAGAKSRNYGYNNRATIAALIDGTIPAGPTLALQAARRLRTLLKRPDLSPQLRADWVELEDQLTRKSEDRHAAEKEEAETVQATREAESTELRESTSTLCLTT